MTDKELDGIADAAFRSQFGTDTPASYKEHTRCMRARNRALFDAGVKQERSRIAAYWRSKRGTFTGAQVAAEIEAVG